MKPAQQLLATCAMLVLMVSVANSQATALSASPNGPGRPDTRPLLGVRMLKRAADTTSSPGRTMTSTAGNTPPPLSSSRPNNAPNQPAPNTPVTTPSKPTANQPPNNTPGSPARPPAPPGPSDLPTLTGAYNTYSYPPPTVPPTANAPFMQTSRVPDGTVFIAVGAILGVFGAAILVWRGIVACLLHRSVERATVAQNVRPDKGFVESDRNFYKYNDHESKMSLTGQRRLNTAGRGPRKRPSLSASQSQTNLFFSPTAPGAGAATPHRDSRLFLPSGYYPPSGATQPSASHGHGHSISLSTLHPSSSRGQLSAMYMQSGNGSNYSPPETPPSGPIQPSQVVRSRSTGSLNGGASGSACGRSPSQMTLRTPSMYLQDLLDEDPNNFPPAASSTPPLKDAYPSQQQPQQQYLAGGSLPGQRAPSMVLQDMLADDIGSPSHGGNNHPPDHRRS